MSRQLPLHLLFCLPFLAHFVSYLAAFEIVFTMEFVHFLITCELVAQVVVGFQFFGQGSGQAKIADFDATLVSQEYITGLEIPMNDISGVQKIDSAQ